MKRSVSIVIPNYNGKHLLETYLPFTIAVTEESGAPYEIIVVDDCSSDGSVAFMQANYPDVKLIVSPQNQGFSHSCNLGVNAAQYELILLLNSDVKLTPGYFNNQWKYFDRADTFGVMGRIIDMQGDGIQDAARMPKFNGLKLKTGYFYYTNKPGEELYTLYLSGANALINAEKLKAIGGFNQLFAPFYGEDLELSIRAWRLNWKCYYEHTAICRHMGQASTKNYKTAQWIKGIYFRNRFFVHAIHLNGFSWLLWFLQITLIDLLPKLLTGNFWMWSSYTGLLKNTGGILSSKKQMRRFMKQYHSHTTLGDVVAGIKSSVKDKIIHRLRA